MFLMEDYLPLNIRKFTNEFDEVSYWITNFAENKKRIKVINPFLRISFYAMEYG